LTATQEALIGATAGTVTASKAVIVDSSKNIAGFGTVGCGALTAASIVCTAGATFGGGAGATGLTIGTDGKLTIDGTIQVNDNVTLQMEGVAADLDGLTLACDNAGDAVLNITAGKLTLTTSDSSITTASVLTLTSATAGIVINAAEAIGISILTSTPTDGINIAAACANAIAISGANTTAAINISGTPPTAINIAPTWVAATSMTPIKIAYNYLGASTTGDTDAYGIRSTITQTSSNALTLGNRGYLMGIRSDIVTNGFTDLCYPIYAKLTVSGASTSGEMFGMVSAMYTGSAEITATWVAGIMVKMDGTGNVVGAGDAAIVACAGVYVSWNETNAMATALTAGMHVAVINGSKLDSGYQVDGGGELTNAFYSRNTSGSPTIVTGLRLDGVHTHVLALPAAAATGPVSDGGSNLGVDAGTCVRLSVLIGEAQYYIIASTAPTFS